MVQGTGYLDHRCCDLTRRPGIPDRVLGLGLWGLGPVLVVQGSGVQDFGRLGLRKRIPPEEENTASND